jgi:CO/xanthine dehydrogenase Mo-binding subunit
MRGVNSVYNVFAVESAIDELAAALGQDPFALRMKWLLKQPRLTKTEPPPAAT